jgi:PAS domain S-box-containing protein
MQYLRPKGASLTKRTSRGRRKDDVDPLIPRSTLYELFTNAPAIIAVLRGPDHVFDLVNPAYQSIFPGRELVGRPIREALPEVEGQGFFEILDRVYATGEIFTAREARVALGDEKFFNFVYQPVLSAKGKVDGIIVFAFDVTTEVSARHQSEEMFRLLVDSVTDYAIFMLDPDGRVATWNDGARRIKGYTREEILGRHLSIFYPEEDVRAGKPQRLLQIARDEGRVEDEGWRVRRDGTRFWANVVITAVLDADRNLRGFAKVTRDVTARKTAEETQRQLLVSQEVNRAKDEFLAVISHEMRSPLTSILGWARMLRIGGLDEETTLEALEALERSAQAQVHLIEDLLDDTRITSGKLRLNKRPLQMKTVVESALSDLLPAADVKKVRLDLMVGCDTCPVDADPVRLQQIIWNVVSNGIKFTPEGGSVSLRVDREDSKARIEVKDTGRGIAPDVLPQLFQRFRQADSSSDRKAGIGLGLAISKYLVEQHGGTIRAWSEGIDRGATFTIELPLAAESADTFARREPNRAEDLADLSGVKVLIVEDEADTRDVLSTVIERCGGEAHSAGLAADAFKEIETWQPDVIVCDIALPDMDGCHFLHDLRKHSSVPALALTVFGSAEEEARVRGCGFDVFRQKPIEPADFAHEIARLAALHTAR